QPPQPFGISSHNSILNAIVDHLHKVTCSVRTTVQVPVFRGSLRLLATRCSWDITYTRRKRREDRIETFDDVCLTANHHAVATLQSPDATARAHVDIVNASRRQFFCAADVVHVIKIAPVDQDVSSLDEWEKISNGVVHDGSRNHQPDRPRRVELLDKVRQRGSSDRFLFGKLTHSILRPIKHHAIVSILD